MSIWFYILLLLSTLSVWVFVRRADPMYRTPMTVLLGSYGITTVIGATATGMLPNLLVFKAIVGDMFLDVRFLRDTNSFLYWFLLYSPFIVVPVVVTITGRKLGPKGRFSRAVAIMEIEVDVFSYSAVLVGLVGLCLLLLAQSGVAGNRLGAAAMSGEQN